MKRICIMIKLVLQLCKMCHFCTSPHAKRLTSSFSFSRHRQLHLTCPFPPCPNCSYHDRDSSSNNLLQLGNRSPSPYTLTHHAHAFSTITQASTCGPKLSCTAHTLLQTPTDTPTFFCTQQLRPALHVSTCCVSSPCQLFSHVATTLAGCHVKAPILCSIKRRGNS